MGTFIDLKGKTFNRLTVLERAENRGHQTYWLCECTCKKKKIILGSEITNGGTKSCGCIRKELNIKTFSTHGYSDKERLYVVWLRMRQRCSNKNNKRYKDWGGRGITVCPEWHNYLTFRTWAYANNYKEELLPSGINKWSIDRIDNDKGYFPENCRWVTMKEQCNNKRNNSIVTYNGETHKMTEWGEIYNINPKVLNQRINTYKWDIETAFLTPLRKRPQAATPQTTAAR